MEPEKNAQSAQLEKVESGNGKDYKPFLKSTLHLILFGFFIGITVGVIGLQVYKLYAVPINNVFLYIGLVLFGIVAFTFILVWGFKNVIIHWIFGKRVAESEDIIAEAQAIANQLSNSVIDKLLKKADDDDKANAKNLILRLSNWFVWGRLRNWWWNWLLGIFVSLGGLMGTILLMNQNELLQNQNQLITNQMSLEEASRRGALVVLMSNIFDKVDREIAEQRDTLIKRGGEATDSTRYSLSLSLIGQIAALSQAFKPYRFMDGDALIDSTLSPERGQLLLTITRLPLDTGTLLRIFEQSTFKKADLSEADLGEAKLMGAKLVGANLMNADLSEAKLNRAKLMGADLNEANLNGANLNGADLSEAHLSEVHLIAAHLMETYLIAAHLNGAHLNGANLNGAHLDEADLREADLREASNLVKDQVLKTHNLSGAKLPKNLDAKKLKKERPDLFRN